MSGFDRAFEIVVGLEGGYSNDPRDAGGETKYGICKRSYPTIDISALTEPQAKDIYKRDYWDRVRGDELPWPLNLYMFDCAVNQGVGVAVMTLQRLCRLQPDAVFGSQTLAAGKALGSESMALYMADRAIRYTETKGSEHYLRGWFKRLFMVTQEA